MKNKIFELYKPRSLQEFFKGFHKNFCVRSSKASDEKFVYVVQQPAPNINILSASDFGYFVLCLETLDQNHKRYILLHLL